MIRIALCDDDKRALTVISGAVQSVFQANGMTAEVQLFHAGDELLRQLGHQRFSLILLDIDMPGLDGIEVGKRIRSDSRHAEIVYVSEREDRVFDALGVQPLGFVRKGNFLNDISAVAELYVREHGQENRTEHIEFQTRTSLISLRLEKIRYVEGSGNYQIIHLSEGEKPVEVKMTMKELEEKLHPRGFIRIHKGYLVNYRFIYRIDTMSLVLLDGQELPISRSKAVDVKTQYLAFLG